MKAKAADRTIAGGGLEGRLRGERRIEGRTRVDDLAPHFVRFHAHGNSCRPVAAIAVRPQVGQNLAQHQRGVVGGALLDSAPVEKCHHLVGQFGDRLRKRQGAGGEAVRRLAHRAGSGPIDNRMAAISSNGGRPASNVRTSAASRLSGSASAAASPPRNASMRASPYMRLAGSWASLNPSVTISRRSPGLSFTVSARYTASPRSPSGGPPMRPRRAPPPVPLRWNGGTCPARTKASPPLARSSEARR